MALAAGATSRERVDPGSGEVCLFRVRATTHDTSRDGSPRGEKVAQLVPSGSASLPPAPMVSAGEDCAERPKDASKGHEPVLLSLPTVLAVSGIHRPTLPRW